MVVLRRSSTDLFEDRKFILMYIFLGFIEKI